MKKRNWLSVGSAAGVVVYITLVSWVMQNAERIFGKMQGLLGITAFLLLFTLSAAIVGALILGKPLMMYWGGQKKEAVTHLGATLGWILIALIVIFAILLAF
jgi:hypothetical protein